MRGALDCADYLWRKGDFHGACSVFHTAHTKFVVRQNINTVPLEDVERFFFDGGDKFLTFAGNSKAGSEARISAAARAEIFFTAYINWYSSLTADQIDKLPDDGRIRSVMRHFGNALVAQNRRNDVHNQYLNTFGRAAQFGPDAIGLWEDVLKQIYGAPGADSSADVKEVWREFGEFIIDWANVPGMLKDAPRERFVKRGKRIIESCS
ncbi:MAG: hypothetical protein ABR589_10565 [Chthoniobacterales bacterium]